MLDINTLPNNVEGLKRLVIEHHAAVQAKDIELREQCRVIEHLRFQLAKLRRARFGQSSEQLEGAGQLPMTFEELRAAVAEAERQAQAVPGIPAAQTPKGKPVRRKKLPEHFERIPLLLNPEACTCPDCGGTLKDLGKDEAEILEVKTVTFKVTKIIRPKKRCVKCATIVQAPAPSRPIQKSFAGASLLALILTWKYGFRLPLYRICQIFAHAGLILSRTTLMQWVGGSAELMGPLVAALAKYVLAASNINGDDTPFRVLVPGTGKTKRGHMWTYVRDGTAWGSTDPPAVWYQYSPAWHGKHPLKHLAGFTGKLQADGYAGLDALFLPSSISFSDQTAAESGPRSFTALLSHANSTTLTRRGICSTCLNGLPTIQSTVSMSSCRGMSPANLISLSRSRRRYRRPDDIQEENIVDHVIQ